MYKMQTPSQLNSTRLEDQIGIEKQQVSQTETLESKSDNHITLDSKLAQTKSEEILVSLLSHLLRYGIISATTVVLIGGILYLIEHGSEPVQYQIFQGTSPDLRSLPGIVNAVLSGNSQAIIQIGLLLLVATPILRVIISFLTFLWHKEFLYVIITFLVLCSLTYSIVAGFSL